MPPGRFCDGQAASRTFRVSKLLGHRQASMTLSYAYAADRELEAAAERVGQVIARMCGFPGACTENPGLID